MKSINITKVVSKNFVMDFVAKIQNYLGMNLKIYESMMDKAVKQIEDELKSKNIRLKWFRYQISELNNGAMVVMLYGEIE